MRGKESPRHSAARSARITPAHAGKRFLRINANVRSWDHPRPCGEKDFNSTRVSHHVGSPPPMRGKGISSPLPSAALGITPAHAGKSIQGNTRYRCRQDHPRPCGEKLAKSLVSSPQQGSPPPMRGKAKISACAKKSIGITPAHAGKRVPGARMVYDAEDHPRPCGEKRYTL